MELTEEMRMKLEAAAKKEREADNAWAAVGRRTGLEDAIWYAANLEYQALRSEAVKILTGQE